MKRKIILFLDNFGGHSPNNTQPYNFSHINIQYFTPNCTSVIQPMDQGIIQCFKVLYRKQVVHRKLESQ